MSDKYGRSLEGRYDVRWDYVQVPVEENVDPSGYITVLQKTVTGTYYYIKDHLGSINADGKARRSILIAEELLSVWIGDE